MVNPIIIDDDVVFLDTAKSIPNKINNENEDKYYYAKRYSVLGAWQPCELLSKIENIDEPKLHIPSYIVKFIRNPQKKDVLEYELASRRIPCVAGNFSAGTRVIARRRNERLPYRIDKWTGEKILLVYSCDTDYYAGVIAGFGDSGILVFFDDGIVQFIQNPYKDIRRVIGNYKWHHAHSNAKPYFDWYFKNERVEAHLKVHQTIKVELNGNCQALAKVLQIEDKILAKIHFEEENRFEWIYLGSPRIFAICRALIIQKACRSANDDVVMLDFIGTERKSNEKPMDNEIIPLPVPNIRLDIPRHMQSECHHLCLGLENKISNLEQYSAFQRPLLTGWKRYGSDRKFYQAPCGVFFHSLNEIDKFLFMTDSKLRIDCFDLSKDCNIETAISKVDVSLGDISHGVEKIPIAVCGKTSSNDKSLLFNYIENYRYDCIDDIKNNLGRIGCDCKDNCRDKLKCSCWQLSIRRMLKMPSKDIDYKRYAKEGYKFMRHHEIIFTGIVECCSDCACCDETCVNRVVGRNGIQHKLEMFKTENKGWGVRAACDIPEAMFICSYAGEILEDSAADQRDPTYHFKLPKFDDIDTDSDDGDDDDDDDDDDDEDGEDEPVPKRQRDESPDVIQPFINYFPRSIQNGNANQFPEPEHSKSRSNGYVVDAKHYGNISRFINHSCNPNLFVQAVYVNNDKRFPWLGFFSSELIKAGKELTIDYRYELSDGEGIKCQCGSGDKCRKRLT